MCELGSTASATSMEHYKYGSAGYPIKGVTIAAFDIVTDKECKFNERGEIRVLTPARMKEYYKRPDATEEFFWKDLEGREWGRTGDIGYVDEDGDVYILGRMTDSFVSKSGITIYNFDIEAVIREDNCVKDCEVVGISKDSYEIPIAHIIKSADCTLSDQEFIDKIHKICKDNLEMDLIPHGYKIVESFPMKNNGKRNMEAIKQDVEGIIWRS